MDSSSADRDPLELVAEEFIQRRRRGESPSIREYEERFPELAEGIRDLFPALEVMEEVDPGTKDLGAPSAGTVADRPVPTPQRLGDYRILREIGRGAMGIVYEAEQQSLGRRVALKVLPKSFSHDGRALARFRREARAAARLHHTNIVPIYEVGQDNDIAYYAMQFIQGHSLDLVLAELRRLRRGGAVTDSAEDSSARTAALSLWHGLIEEQAADSASAVAAPSEKLPVDASDADAYYRTVARLGNQVASALEYAHRRGTIHRDIKPSNLLLDASGIVWVADFGLAKFEDDEHTRTGDIVGTLRYMSPERFQGKCDSRSDIYSLGLTLYEMLVLRPAFESEDQLALIERISKASPPPPRSVDPRIPRDLETIVLKAVDREPAKRYLSSAEMAEDLRRFLDDEPIHARRLSPAERFARWARRNRQVAALTVAIFVLSLLIALGAAVYSVDVRVLNRQLIAQNAVAQDGRKVAVAARDELTSLLYIADMKEAQRAWDDGHLVRVVEILERYLPEPGKLDRRGFEWHYLWRSCQRSLDARFIDVPDMVTSVSFSHDNRLLAAQHYNGTITLWDVASLAFKDAFRSYRGEDYFAPLAFSPTKNIVAYPSENRNGVTLRNLDRGEERHMGGNMSTIHDIAFSPDGHLVAAGGKPGTKLCVWNVETGRIDRTIEGAKGDGHLAFSADGRFLAAGARYDAGGYSPDGVLGVWDVHSGQLQRRFKATGFVPGRQKVCSVMFSPDGKYLAVSLQDGTDRVFEFDTGKETILNTDILGDHNLVFTPDGKTLVSASAYGAVTFWDLTTFTVRDRFVGHSRWTRLAASADGRYLASGGPDEYILLRDLHKTTPRESLQSDLRVRDFVFCPGDGLLILFVEGTQEASLKLWNWRDQRASATDFGFDGVPDDSGARWPPIKPLAISPTGLLAVRCKGDQVHLWDSRSRETRGVLSVNTPVRAMAISADGTRLATGGSDGTLSVWDTLRSVLLWVGRQHTGEINDISFSPHGMTLASVSRDGSLITWDARTGRIVRSIIETAVPIQCVAYSPDGTLLGAADEDGAIRLWNSPDTAEDRFHLLHLHTRHTCSLAFSPDGSTLLAATPGGVRIVDVATCRERFVFTPAPTIQRATFPSDEWVPETFSSGNWHRIARAAFSPDGHALVACAGAGSSTDGRLWLWHGATAETSKPARITEGRLSERGDRLQWPEPLGSMLPSLRMERRGDALGSVGRWEEALAAYNQALTLRPNDPYTLKRCGDLLARRGRWQEALADYDRALENRPGDCGSLSSRAALVLQLGSRETYRRRCRELIDRFLDLESFDPRPCLIVPDGIDDREMCVRRARELAAPSQGDDSQLPARLFNKALAEYRSGQYQQ